MSMSKNAKNSRIKNDEAKHKESNVKPIANRKRKVGEANLDRKNDSKNRNLPSLKSVVIEPAKFILNSKKIFFGISILYSVLLFIFIKGFGFGFSLEATKSQLDEFFLGSLGKFDESVTLFSELLSSYGSTTDAATGVYQFFLTIFMILALIYLCREIMANKQTSVKDAFYKGMYPIIPFILVLIVVAIQTLPLVVGNFFLTTVITNGLISTMFERIVWYGVFILLASATVYMITSSIFALIISTLHDVTPFQALRSANKLVAKRRLKIILRFFILFVFTFLGIALLFFPLVLLSPLVAELLFLLVGSLSIAYLVAGAYNIYRQLL